MGRRKAEVPVKLNENQQRLLTWQNRQIDNNTDFVPVKRARIAKTNISPLVDQFSEFWNIKTSDVCDQNLFLLGVIDLQIMKSELINFMPQFNNYQQCLLNTKLYLDGGELPYRMWSDDTVVRLWLAIEEVLIPCRLLSVISASLLLDLSHRSRIVSWIFNAIDDKDEEFITCSLRCCLNEHTIYQLQYSSQYLSVSNKQILSIERILTHFHFNIETLLPISCKNEEKKTNFMEDIINFYTQLKLFRLKSDLHIENISTEHDSLIPRLRPYQKSAVQFMLYREKQNEKLFTHPFYRLLTDAAGHLLWYNSVGGIFTRNEPLILKCNRGGILADEMGLGKTVEVLACILLNPKDSNNFQAFKIDRPTNALEHVENGLKLDLITLMDELISTVTSTLAMQAQITEESVSRCSRRRIIRNNALIVHAAEEELQTVDHNQLKLQCFCGASEIFNWRQCLVCSLCSTVQHIQCVGWNLQKWPSLLYTCPQCAVMCAEPIASRATLIICPASICLQWYEEIYRHLRLNALSICMYRGIGVDGYIHPRNLADFDIVITSYERFKTEINYVDLQPNSRLRHPKRFVVPPSPLPAVHWWRICLDEAQMVESVNSNVAQMCLRLSADNRWCVTGTPIQKSVKDLHGLMVFLGVEPYWVQKWFFHSIANESERNRLLHSISSIFWRTEKNDVLDQLFLPDHRQRDYWLDFSPIEEHFYRRTLEDCCNQAKLVLQKLPQRNMLVSELDRDCIDRLLRPLLRLRQACCHPQLARGHLISLNKATLTMEEVLEQMCQKTKQEAEEQQRLRNAALCGLAGIDWLCEQFSDAAENYREILRAHRCAEVRTDPLQLLHVYHNLAELLSSHRSQISPTISDDILPQQATNVRNEYLQSSLTTIRDTCYHQKKISDKVADATADLKEMEYWWVPVASDCRREGVDIQLLDSIADAMARQRGSIGANFVRYKSVDGLNYHLTMQWDKMKSARTELIASLAALSDHDVTGAYGMLLASEAAACHLRPSQKTQQVALLCEICKVHERFDAYEMVLFNFSKEQSANPSEFVGDDDQGTRVFGQLMRGTWADSNFEQILKIVQSFSSRHLQSRDSLITDAAATFIRLLNLCKKEFRALRSYWMAIRDYVAALDELQMATERLRLRLPNDLDNVASIIIPAEIPIRKTSLLADLFTAKQGLQRKLGQKKYLERLREQHSDDRFKNEGNTDECPICRVVLGHKWCVLTCGHCFCCDCLRYLLARQPSTLSSERISVKCPLCRERTLRAQMSMVQISQANKSMFDANGQMQLNGSYSSKVEAVVRCLLSIRKSNHFSKSILFSCWPQVLEIISLALTENHLPHVLLTGPNANFPRFQQKLTEFKTSLDLNIALLPLSTGGRGLNIVEANHVLLVEPQLNVAVEQQAFGRVLRIGQKQETTLHRFYLHSTIEHKIHALLDYQKSSASSNGSNCAASNSNHLLPDMPFTVQHFSELFDH